MSKGCNHFRKEDYCKKMDDICGVFDKKRCGLREAKPKKISFTWGKRAEISDGPKVFRIPVRKVSEIKADGKKVYGK